MFRNVRVMVLYYFRVLPGPDLVHALWFCNCPTAFSDATLFLISNMIFLGYQIIKSSKGSVVRASQNLHGRYTLNR
jgi:hypothetical protein